MTKPDRIARALNKVYARDGRIYFFQAMKLLRREAAYQRARMRKIIKTEMAIAKGQCYAEYRGDTLNELLAKLTPRRTR